MSIQDTSFRDQLYNVDEEGRRVGFFPKKPSGYFYRWRGIVSWTLLGILFAMPWIRVGGEPFMMFNFLERKFVLFGKVFWPSDFYLFVIAAITGIVSIVLFTVVFGRIWCGWACPQTIFLEMVFRKLDYLFEGDYIAQKRLRKAPWNADKIIRKSTKHFLFLIISFLIANTFLAYLVGTDTLLKYITHSPAAAPITFLSVTLFSGAFYFVFAWFRELACIMVCPYGRLQGVLLDENSLVISYDFKRGEPRGKLKKTGEAEAEKGDCIDCKQCIAVCPTGIDIRNGTQLECVNCTACIDACDDVMLKVKKPVGLIRYATHKQIAQGEKFRFTPRAVAYSVVLVALLFLLTGLLFFKSDMGMTLHHPSGATYSLSDKGEVVNSYNLSVINKTSHERKVKLHIQEGPGAIRLAAGGDEIVLKPSEEWKGAALIVIPRPEVKSSSMKLKVGLSEEGKEVKSVKVTFLGPF